MSWETQHEQVPLYADWLAATAVIACASFVLLAAMLLPLPGQIVVVGCLVSVLVGLFVSAHARLAVRIVLPRDLETPLLLASDGVFYGQYQRLAALLVKTSRQTDPIYRALASDQVDALIGSLTTIAAGTLVFEGTDANAPRPTARIMGGKFKLDAANGPAIGTCKLTATYSAADVPGLDTPDGTATTSTNKGAPITVVSSGEMTAAYHCSLPLTHSVGGTGPLRSRLRS